MAVQSQLGIRLCFESGNKCTVMSQVLLELWSDFSTGIIFPLASRKVVWRCRFAFILYYILWEFSVLLSLILEAQLQENTIQSCALCLLTGLRKILLYSGPELVLCSSPWKKWMNNQLSALQLPFKRTDIVLWNISISLSAYVSLKYSLTASCLSSVF